MRIIILCERRMNVRTLIQIQSNFLFAKIQVQGVALFISFQLESLPIFQLTNA